ncbi:MAG: MFS transporter, partial [Bradyrhizobium sp.]
AAAMLVPNSLALLNHAYPDAKARGRAVGVWAAGASLALTAGPLAGGVLIALTGWRAIFLVNVPIGLVGLWLTWRFADETPRAKARRLDLPGQATAILALGILAGAIIEGGVLGWRNGFVLGGVAASAILAMLFVLRERSAEQPMLPLQLFRRRSFALAALVGVLVNIAFYGLIFVLSLYFQRLDGLSPLQTGLAFTPMLGVVLPVNLIAARLSERWGAPLTIAAGALIASAGALGLLIVQGQTPYVMLCAQLMALGGGLGLLVPPMTSMLLGSVDKQYSGIASGVLNSARQTGSVVGVALFGALVAEGASFGEGLRLSLAIAAGLLIASAAVVTLGRGAKERYR